MRTINAELNRLHRPVVVVIEEQEDGDITLKDFNVQVCNTHVQHAQSSVSTNERVKIPDRKQLYLHPKNAYKNVPLQEPTPIHPPQVRAVEA